MDNTSCAGSVLLVLGDAESDWALDMLNLLLNHGQWMYGKKWCCWDLNPDPCEYEAKLDAEWGL